jgi:hypothetical protein
MHALTMEGMRVVKGAGSKTCSRSSGRIKGWNKGGKGKGVRVSQEACRSCRQ